MPNCCVKFVSCLSILLLLIFTTAFVIIPIFFKYSTDFQRGLVFPTWYVTPKNYSDLHEYPLKGVRNFYLEVNEEENITLGLIHILPSEVLSEFVKNDDYYDYEKILEDPKYNLLVFFHGNGQDRLGSVGTFKVLRKFFNIISFDYRGYGDSSSAKLNESGVVDDCVQLINLIKNMTNSRIFFWGHSLGTGVAVHVASVLKKSYNFSPSGIILEAPFTSVTDVMKENPIIKVYSWLPWFDWAIIDPMVDHGFQFDSQSYISDVDCPIMIIHAKDDEIIPFKIATELYNIATSQRNSTYQGDITIHLLEDVGYGHEWIFEEPALPEYISDFVNYSIQFEKNKSREGRQ